MQVYSFQGFPEFLEKAQGNSGRLILVGHPLIILYVREIHVLKVSTVINPIAPDANRQKWTLGMALACSIERPTA